MENTPTTNFLQSAPGNYSSGRLMFVIWGVFACVMCVWVYAQSHDYLASLAIFTAIAGTATAHKGVQGYNENQSDPPKIKSAT